MVDRLEGFVLEKELNFHHDGFRGTIIEIGLWKEQRVAVKFGIKELQEYEAKMMKEIGYHPNIIQLVELKEDSVVIEAFGTGKTLHNIEEKVPLKTIVDWMLQVSSALKHLHDKGIIHHDIKDKNVLIHEGKIKLCDFELSIKGKNGVFGSGTTKWMAPEIEYDDEIEITNKIDIYAFGLLFSRLIHTGREIDVVKYSCPIKILNLIYDCIDRKPENRPNIDQVIKILSLSDYGNSILGDLLEKADDENKKKVLEIISKLKFD